ncbi:MAG: interleukin-like EMT inducer domain-containing protein, partial [Anaerolineae bacterium]
DQQRVSLEVNGQRLDPVVMRSGWNTYSWDVPAEAIRSRLNDVRFRFDRLDAPAEVLPGNGAIGMTGLQSPVAIEVNSGGPAGFAFIAVGSGDDAEDGSVHSPGYNVAVIHPQSGKLLDLQGFDTTPSGGESNAVALAEMIDAVPDGRIVAVALQGDGAAHLTEDAVRALSQIGGQADLRGTTGWSHALIGVKGAAPGTALEAAGPDQGWLRAAPDRRTLAIAVDLILWERVE